MKCCFCKKIGCPFERFACLMAGSFAQKIKASSSFFSEQKQKRVLQRAKKVNQASFAYLN
jgi:hypothetical protein